MMALGYRVPISLNISGKNLYDPNFYDRSIKIISDSGVPKDLIEFELTESTLMINPDECKAVLKKFVDAGIKISLDDFGSGYSSLAYLSQFPLEFIKIDRYFVMNFEANPALISIVKSTVELSKTLGYKVVIEGVESKEVVDIISAFECDYAQGYYFAKPMTSDDTNAWYELNG
jgi:EAL domain-containing protein (putative c-di-GMP-specific phosphodiesterase class I)